MAVTAGSSANGAARDDGAGHRVLPHPADLVVEAWAPTRAGCLAEAVAGLVASFADTEGLTATGERRLRLEPAPPGSLLVALLEDVVYGLDVDGLVPVGTSVRSAAGGGLDVRFATVSAEAVTQTGPVPKAVARSGLTLAETAGRWRARALVDV